MHGMKGITLNEMDIRDFYCGTDCIYDSELFAMMAVAFVAVAIALDP